MLVKYSSACIYFPGGYGTADEMMEVCKNQYVNIDFAVFAAAVADYKLSKPLDKKHKKAQETTELPGHCSKIKNMNDEFIKEYEVSAKNLDDVQNNVFDKYNYDVFYNELGENSLDIQGVFNHEVNGFEKAIF